MGIENLRHEKGYRSMAIETVKWYHPQMRLPLWAKLEVKERNLYKVGKTYDIRVKDIQRQEEQGGEGPYNYTHQSVLVAKREVKYGDIDPVMLALLGNHKNPEEVKDRLSLGIDGDIEDEELVLLIFMRIDKAKEMVVSDDEIIVGSFVKEEVEADNYPQRTR